MSQQTVLGIREIPRTGSCEPVDSHHCVCHVCTCAGCLFTMSNQYSTLT